MAEGEKDEFQAKILCYLDAAYNYAYWLTRNPHDAEDLTQEACQRAYSAFDRFRHENARAWLLTIVRHTYLSQKQKHLSRADIVYLDPKHFDSESPGILTHDKTPEDHLLQTANSEFLHDGIAALPDDYREIIILRELEELSYNEIAIILDCAIGTVMSRLSRARDKLKVILSRDQRYQDSLHSEHPL